MSAARDDHALHRAVRARDADTIIRILGGLAWRATEGYYLPGAEIDDLLQEARVGIAAAVRDFRGEPAAFPAFAWLCARRQVITAVKTATRGKHRFLTHAVSLDAPLAGGGVDADRTLADVIPLHGGDPLDRVLAREHLAETLAVLATEASDLERDALIAIDVAGITYEDAAARFGVGPKSIDNALTRVRGKIADPAVRAHARRFRRLKPRRVTVYVPRRERFTPAGFPTGEQASAAACRQLGAGAIVVDCVKRGLSPDGQERADTRGHPRADGRRPTAVWRVTLEVAP